MKQTAVEWFFNELQRMQYFIGNDMVEAYNQAKEMEKQQIIDAYKQGQFDGDIIRDTDAEQYYNQTFKEIEKL
jgi:hypothetical protein